MSDAPTEPADWYARNYPDAPPLDYRCLAVLASWERLYNLHPTGRSRRDGGFRAIPGPRGDTGAGVEVRFPQGSLSTYDDAGLTRLVVAAHRYACRVSVSARSNLLIVMVHPRSHDMDLSFYERHPDGLALAAMATGGAA